MDARSLRESCLLVGRLEAALSQLHFERFLARLAHQRPTTDWAKVKAGIVRARKDFERHGFCFSLGHWNPELYAVGVPLTRTEGTPVFSVSVSRYAPPRWHHEHDEDRHRWREWHREHYHDDDD